MPIYLTPSGSPLVSLVPELRHRLHCLRLNMIDEDLTVVTPYTVYQAEHRQWESFPKPRVRRIDVEGFESSLVEGTDFSIDYVNGRITLTLPLLHLATADDSIRVDYTFDVFSDAQLEGFLIESAREIKVAIHRGIELTAIPDDYKEAILKRAYTNAFKCLIEQTFTFFNVTVMGRTVDKAMLVDTIKKIIETNEEILQKEINNLINFNQTQRFE
jgi:hypothetical protein